MAIPIEELYQIYRKHSVISKDSRKIEAGCIYFALSGENFDGNQFAEEAIQKGAAYAVIDDEKFKKSDQYIVVENTLETLQGLARYHRSQLNYPIIGITGSNGKTTTKELIHRVLSQKYRAHSTQGNYNNHIGVPLTLLQLTQDHEMGIIEMGANHQGEIAFLSSIARPDYGLITNIGKAHLEGFGGMEGVRKGKSELYKYLSSAGGTIFINQDDEVLLELAGNLKRVTYGSSAVADCRGVLLQEHPQLKGEWTWEEKTGMFQASLYGTYNFYNILSAICIGCNFEVPADQINQAIGAYLPDNNRSQLIIKGTTTIYLDAYNANPNSMQAAIDNFSKKPGKKMVILGDMFELGEHSLQEHKTLLDHLKPYHFDQVIAIGSAFYHTAPHSDITCFKEKNAALDYLKQQDFDQLSILVKGSRGMALETLMQELGLIQ
jgi:UDP-N-acetylmuramoyl-tripeptide--D-alanyl-D-alanine ligase